MNRQDKQLADRQAQHLRQRKLKGKFFETYKGVLMDIMDATGRPIQKGHLVHIPTSALPDIVATMEVVDIIEPSGLVVPGQPAQQPRRVVLNLTLVIPVNPKTNAIPYTYVVGMRHKAPAQDQAKVSELKLASEQPPEGIELPVEEKPQ